MKTLKLYADDIRKGSLILVNSLYPLRMEPGKDTLIPVEGKPESILLERQTARMLAKVLAYLNCSGEIVPVSGFRTMAEQQELYAGSLSRNGIDFTQKFVALPGCSEHQTGLAVDMAENKEDIDDICPDFPYEGICQIFRENAARYGFIERYPAGKEEITRISHEPWHFRYVGYPHSRLITETNGTLEEYTSTLKRFQNEPLRVSYSGQHFQICFVQIQSDPVEIEIPDLVPYQISGNNQDGVIITLWGRNP